MGVLQKLSLKNMGLLVFPKFMGEHRKPEKQQK